MRPKELVKTQRFVHRHFVPDAAPIAPALSAAYRHQGEIPIAGAFAALAPPSALGVPPQPIARNGYASAPIPVCPARLSLAARFMRAFRGR